MNDKELNEAEICMRRITPAIERAGWDLQRQVRREYVVGPGQVIVRGNLATRKERRRADYILCWSKNLPIAVVEAKQRKFGVGAGMQQALAYAEALDVPFAFSSNGEAFLVHDRTGHTHPVEREIALSEFPSPDQLWRQYRYWKNLSESQTNLLETPFYEEVGGKQPYYYQRVAVNRSLEAIGRGQKRLLLVMATGTGKTYTAFQIIWRLWRAGRAKRILFLADRNILTNQAMTNDFKPFGGAMTKIRNRKVDKSYEVYLALYQAVSGTEEEKDIYKQFSPDFFDVIVIDECHRSSAAEASAWHEILNYFHSATQIGLTATPKETRDVSNITYFGDPVYTYSLKQGIEDGFLAPFRVIRVDLDKDLLGWRPEPGAVDDLGQEIEDREYNQRDFDRILVLNQRTKLVAKKVIELLEHTNPYGKTIVFCEDIDHAERMRQAIVNANPDRANEDRRYVMRITGDNEEGKAQLDYFIHPEHRYPVIATTSRLMTTGVDAKTCELVVLDRRIEAMTEFKQIIGRGTRIHEDTGKLYFTILDFKKATTLFADPDFDGEPVVVYEPNGGDVVPPDDGEDKGGGMDDDGVDSTERRRKFIVSGVPVEVVAERVHYYGKDGKLITESLRDYTKKAVLKEYKSLNEFLNAWSAADRKQAILDELVEQGVIIEALEEHVGQGIDPFDLICHVVFGRPPLTRRERTERVRKRDVFTKYGEEARRVLDALLEKYSDRGIGPVENLSVLRVPPFSAMGTPIELVNLFGGKKGYQEALEEMEHELYRIGNDAA
jgi:type I restriction enzyme R subunit